MRECCTKFDKESFGQNYPEDFDGALDCVSMAITSTFNRHGTLLAVGCNDGRMVFWDFLTRGIAKIINAHVHPVCTLSWSRNGRKLLSAATDNTVSLWDVFLGEVEKTFRFPCPILKVQFHPRSSEKFLVCPMKHPAVAMDIDGTHKLIPLDEDSDLNIVASYDRKGKYIFTGNAKGRENLQQQNLHTALLPSLMVAQPGSITGPATYFRSPSSESRRAVVSYWIKYVHLALDNRLGGLSLPKNSVVRVCVFAEDSHALKASFRVTTGTMNTTAIKSIEFARRGDCFLVNSADRIIRVYESGEVLACGKDGEPEPIQKLQDLVNRTLWKKCCFSGDGEYIVAGSAKQHSLYIWEKSVGNLVKILHGTKGELLLDVAWHPVRPIIASISSGVVSVWAQNQVENWSAFAPDFKELDENVEYDERESEFDIEEEDKEKEDFKGQASEDIDVDVTSVDPIQAFVSSDEEEEDTDALLYLPVAPDIDEPEEGWPIVSENQPPGVQEDPSSHSEKRKSTQETPESVKRRKLKALDVDLPTAPLDEIHPLLNVKKPNEKQHKKPTTKSKPKSGKSDRSKHRD